MATVRNRVETQHKTSAPNRPGPVQKSQGGATLAVSDNAAVRADGFDAPRPVRNVSPAIDGKGGVPSRVPKYNQTSGAY